MQQHRSLPSFLRSVLISLFSPLLLSLSTCHVNTHLRKVVVRLYASSIHPLFILYSSSIHPLFILYSSSIHPLFISYSSSIHPRFILYSSTVHLFYSSSIVQQAYDRTLEIIQSPQIEGTVDHIQRVNTQRERERERESRERERERERERKKKECSRRR
jgi:hypothetical protein